MTDQAWAILIGAATAAALRIIDFFFPKGRWYNWGGKTSTEKDDEQDAADATDDAKVDVKRRRTDKNATSSRRARDAKRHLEEDRPGSLGGSQSEGNSDD